jgi:4-amino-4-deoxy-L-arabinose transferase-like glycosyltransferase
LVAAFLRLWYLGVNPPHLTPDEASLGYNAYSILKTGRDEYGEILPIIFKSFGDYKPGLYVYATVPFVALFGLTEFAVRLPSAIAGVAAVWLLYLIINLMVNGQWLRNELLTISY